MMFLKEELDNPDAVRDNLTEIANSSRILLGIYFYEHARYKNVHFDMHIQGVEEEALIGDERRLQQIMVNLFSNSLRFTPDVVCQKRWYVIFFFILMDINMPVMDGYEAAKAIRNSEKDDAKTVPIFAMTANAFSEDVAQALEAGMNRHIAKPIDVQILERQNTELKKRADLLWG